MPTSHNYDSYPPSFRPPPGAPSPGPSPPMDPTLEDTIPVIDFQDLDSGSLAKACREWGIFRVIDHGIPVELLTEVLDLTNRFFSQSFERKQGTVVDPLFYFSGSPSLSMSGNSQQTGPSVETQNCLEGLNVPLDKVSKAGFQDPLLQNFRSVLVEYGAHQTRLAQALFDFMVKDLNVPPSKTALYFSPVSEVLRVYRYLRCHNLDQKLGIMEHTDSSVLTILHQDQVGGLQFCKNGKWLDVEPIHNTLIVNLGDMMQVISDDKYTSVLHRVKVCRQKERISMGYFVFPVEDVVIESSKYKPFTYAEFQAKKAIDVKTMGIKVGLPRFKVD